MNWIHLLYIYDIYIGFRSYAVKIQHKVVYINQMKEHTKQKQSVNLEYHHQTYPNI